MKFSAIEKAYKEADLKSEREHVTPYIWKNGTANGGNIFKPIIIRIRLAISMQMTIVLL